MLNKNMNLNGDTTQEIHTITDHSPTSIMEKPAHTVLSRRMSKLRPIKNTNQNGDTTLEIHMIMHHLLISTMVKLLLTQ
jgi:hypothetical protein